MNLRLAWPSDAPVLAEVHAASWLQAYQGIVPDSHLQGLSVEHRADQFRQALASGAEETYMAAERR